MPLVEVVAPPLPIAASWRGPWRLVERWGKTPVAAPTRPGFIVNRVNRPFTIEALRILEAGEATIEEIDAAMRAGGFPMGPFELMDFIGLDVNLAAARGLGRPRPTRPAPAVDDPARALVAAGDLGRKTGRGFYRYEDGRRDREAVQPPTSGLGRASWCQRDPSSESVDAIDDEAALAVDEGVAHRGRHRTRAAPRGRPPDGPFESR